MKFAKIILLINGVVDVLIGISLVFLPNIMAQLLGLPALQIHSLYFAGGWGIAAISFGVARIWAAFVDKFVWYNVILGLFEGSILTVFSIVIPFLYSGVTFIHVSMSLAVGSSFMVIYAILLILHVTKKKTIENNAKEN
ncbi:MAG: hypothetical protein KAJ76_01795 [Candidatus Heimdallarchaeota archaeon]|nr:hypothetical protein [Candidatus Heimdallarchaeota archaeon]